MRLGELAVAQQHVVAIGERRAIVGAEAEPRERISENRPAENSRQARNLIGRSGLGSGAGDDQPSFTSLQRSRQPLERLRRGDGTRRVHGSERAGLGRSLGARDRGLLFHVDERLTHRQVEMDGTGGPLQCRRDGAARQRTIEPIQIDALGWHRDVEAPTHVPGEQARLSDRLRRTAVAKLRRPIGGQDDQRDVRERCFDHRRKIVRGRRPGRAEQHDGATLLAGKAESKEAARSLVGDDEHTDTGGGGQRERYRTGARARRDTGGYDARALELFGDRLPHPAVRVTRRAHPRPHRARRKERSSWPRSRKTRHRRSIPGRCRRPPKAWPRRRR